MERLDRNQWKQYQNLMQDSGKFVELIYSIEWEEGLKQDISQSKNKTFKLRKFWFEALIVFFLLKRLRTFS